MKIPLKYGIAVTLVIAGWVALKHFVLHLEGPPAQIADVVIFNLAAITGLTLGIREKRIVNGGLLRFGDGLVTGIKIAVTYAILISAYFAILLALVGPKLMQQEGETSVVMAFLGIGIGFTIFGIVFSAIIALILRKKLAMNIGGC
jgi:preprotein translocase subunit Sec61beta